MRNKWYRVSTRKLYKILIILSKSSKAILNMLIFSRNFIKTKELF